MLVCTMGLASQAQGSQDQRLKSYHYVEAQGGLQLTATDADITKLLNPTFGLSYGYMTPVVGGRLHVNGIQSKVEDFKWNYIDVNADLLLNVTNLFASQYSRPVNLFLLGGVGMAGTWKHEVPQTGVKHNLTRNLRAGLRLETNVTKPLGLSLEVTANSMNDHFNGKLNNSDDWGFTAMVGVSYRFGCKYETVAKPVVAEEVKPTYYQMMTTQLKAEMDVWAKKMPNETLEDYQLRVNDETRAAQSKKLEYDISTRMATDLLSAPDMTVGDYNTSLNKLALHFNSMPDIFLDVNPKDAISFLDNKDVQLRNQKYKLNPDDSFELVYAEVFNPTTNQVYIFDNQQDASLATIKADEHFVPLTVIRQSEMEETRLQAIKDDIANLAYQKQLISDKTRITVKTDVQPETENGHKLINYDVKFTYEVDDKYSAREDFKPGRYVTKESGAATSMLEIMKKAFETDFAQYCKAGKQVKFRITGTADAAPINRPLPYNGQYGEHRNQQVAKNGRPTTVTLTSQDGIADNDQLAFARALGVRHYIENDMPAFRDMKRDYEYCIEVAPDKGSQYRRISVECLFVDAF